MSENNVRAEFRKVALVTRSIVGLAAIVAAIYLLNYLVTHRPRPESKPDVQLSRRVEAVAARKVPVRVTFEAFGTSRAMTAADIAAEVTAKVISKPDRIEEGAYVEQGELLFQLDDSDFIQVRNRSRETIAALEAQISGLDIELERLEEQLRLAEEATRLAMQELQRLKDALANGAAKDIEVDRTERDLTRIRREEDTLRQQVQLIPVRRRQLQAQVMGERAQLAIAEKNVSRTRITAPFAGYLQEVRVNAGDNVRAGDRVARLVDLSRIEIPILLPLSAADSVRVGDEVQLHEDSPANNSWQGHVSRISPEADNKTRTVAAYVEVAQSPREKAGEKRLRPGQFLAAKVITGRAEEAIVVPRRAVVDERILIADKTGRVHDFIVHSKRHIDGSFPEIDPRETEWAVLADDIAPGTRIIISNLEELEPGMQVETRLATVVAKGTGK